MLEKLGIEPRGARGGAHTATRGGRTSPSKGQRCASSVECSSKASAPACIQQESCPILRPGESTKVVLETLGQRPP